MRRSNKNQAGKCFPQILMMPLDKISRNLRENIFLLLTEISLFT